MSDGDSERRRRMIDELVRINLPIDPNSEVILLLLPKKNCCRVGKLDRIVGLVESGWKRLANEGKCNSNG